MAERRADAASYSVMDWLKCEYMQDKIGDEFTGTISSVTGFGLFVELNDIFIEGLVHISELNNDYYHFDPVRHCLDGERSKQRYSLGGTVQVRVVRVNLDEKKIDLQIVGSNSAGGSDKGALRNSLRKDSSRTRNKPRATDDHKKRKQQDDKPAKPGKHKPDGKPKKKSRKQKANKGKQPDTAGATKKPKRARKHKNRGPAKPKSDNR